MVRGVDARGELPSLRGARRKRLLPECEQVGLGEGAECGGIREAAVEVECALRDLTPV